ncbi:MAG: hypothetical protein AAFW60_09865 [Pseudomonadota bacterium]
MTRSLLERLKNSIRDNLLDFLEVDSQDSPQSFRDMSPSEILSRLKLRLGAVEAERYRLAELLTSEHDHGQFDAKASAALDAGNERLAREILRVKVDHATARTDAAEAMADLEDEANELYALIALIEEEDALDASLEEQLAKYESVLIDSAPRQEEG